MFRPRKPPSQTWHTFLNNHLKILVSVDFSPCQRSAFRCCTFLVLAHERRRVVHFNNVTAHPTAEWTAQQLREAFPFDRIPRYLLRDRDKIFGDDFRQQGPRHEDPGSAFGSAVAVAASLRRARDWFRTPGVLGPCDRVQRRLPSANPASYFSYYHETRPHLSLGKDSPESRPVQRRELGSVVAIAQVGGLHHRYERRAA